MGFNYVLICFIWYNTDNYCFDEPMKKIDPNFLIHVEHFKRQLFSMSFREILEIAYCHRIRLPKKDTHFERIRLINEITKRMLTYKRRVKYGDKVRDERAKKKNANNDVARGGGVPEGPSDDRLPTRKN